MSVQNKKALIEAWQRTLSSALDADSWGQSLEAIDEYQKLVRLLDTQIEQAGLSLDEQTAILKLRLALNLRIDGLQDLFQKKGLQLEQAKKLPEVFKNILSGHASYAFPINLSQHADAIPADYDLRKSESGSSGAQIPTLEEFKEDADSKAPSATNGNGSLLPPLTLKTSGVTTISIFIEKIGLKDAQTRSYMDGRITTTVVGPLGNRIGPAQDTPVSNRLKPNCVLFGYTVHIQCTLEELKDGSAIFFEFKHYKPQTKKVSTRCHAFMEKDEIKPNSELCLELYKKPTDFTKKRVNLFTVKPLFLHVKLIFQKH
jgi:hypothetical protein